MKRTRQIAIICSLLLLVQSGVMGVLLLWFNRFSTDVFYQIQGMNFRLLTLYLGVLLGVTCLYTAYFYHKATFLSATFFIIVGIVGVVDASMLIYPELQVNVFFVIYVLLLSLGFIYVGISGYYYRVPQKHPKATRKETQNEQRKDPTVSTQVEAQHPNTGK